MTKMNSSNEYGHTGEPGRPDFTGITVETIGLLVRRGTAVLREHGVPNARNNAEWILCHSLQCRRIDLYVSSADVPTADQAKDYWMNITRRAGREPLQYILGTTEFMSLPFLTPGGVFVPRPDTEVLIETAEARLRDVPIDRSLHVLDLCCGSGVVAVSLAARIPNLTVTAVDACENAVESTKTNATLNRVADRIVVVGSEACAFFSQPSEATTASTLRRSYEVGRPMRFSAIVCNPPYIETSQLESLPPEVRDHEPRAALDGGADGLDFYRRVAPMLPRWLEQGGFAAFEIGDTQGAEVSAILLDAGLSGITVTPDFAGRDRVVIGDLPGAET
jgi:release factor glutamine methyltransferase